MMTFVKKLVKDEEGATMVEYGLMLALIAIICIAAVMFVGNSASTLFETIGNTLSGAS